MRNAGPCTWIVEGKETVAVRKFSRRSEGAWEGSVTGETMFD